MAVQEFTGSLDPMKYNDPRLDAYASQIEKQKGIPAGFLLGLKNGGEKSGSTAVNSKSHAAGVMQFIPSTWAAYGQGKDPANPYHAIEAAGDYAVDLLKRYKGNTIAAAAEYNGGTSQAKQVMAGQTPSKPETAKYIQNTAPYTGVPAFTGTLDAAPATKGPVEFTGTLDTPANKAVPSTSVAAFTGELDKPTAKSTTPPTDWTGGGNPLAAPKQLVSDISNTVSNLGGQISDIYHHPIEALKQSASTVGKMADFVASIPNMAVGYGAGAVAGLTSGSTTVAKNVKDEVQKRLSVDQALQNAGLATDNPEPFTNAVDQIAGKPAQALADTVTTPGTFENDVARDAAMFAIPMAGHKGLHKLSDIHTGPTPLPVPHEAVPEAARGVQGELFPEATAQAGPLPETPIEAQPRKLTNLIQQAREAANPPTIEPFKTDLGVLGKPEEFKGELDQEPVQGKLFPEEQPEQQAGYPNQEPPVEYTGPVTDQPHPNVVEPWTTGEPYLGPEAPMYTGQNELHINPLDQLITEAQKASEPKPEAAPAPVVPPTSATAPELNGTQPIGKQMAFTDVDPQFAATPPEQVGHMLDEAGKADRATGIQADEVQDKSREAQASLLDEKRDAQLLMSPENVFSKFNITGDTIQPLNGRSGEAYPNWYRRLLWNKNPILRSAYDNLAHISDKVNYEIRKALHGQGNEHPSASMDTLDKAEIWQESQAKTKFEGRTTPEMVDEGRNHFNEQEWQDRGVSPKVAKSLVEAGRMYDLTLKAINSRLEKLGQPQIKPIPNYYPHQLNGEFRVTVVDKESGQQHVTAFKSLADARRQAEGMQANLPPRYAVDYKRAPRAGQSFHDLSEQLKQQAAKFHGTDPSGFHNMIAAVNAKLNRARLGAKELRTGALEHAGAHGFPNDAVGAQRAHMESDADFLHNQPKRYVNDAARFMKQAYMDELQKGYKAAAEAHGASHTQAWANLQKIIREQAEAYTHPLYDPTKASLPEKAVDALSSMFDHSNIPGHVKQPAIGRQTLSNVVRGFGRMALWTKISPWMNPHLLAVQYAQHALSPISSFSEQTLMRGRNIKGPTTLGGKLLEATKSPIKSMAAIVKAHIDTIADMGHVSLNPESTAAIKWATEHGHLDTLRSYDNVNLTKQLSSVATGTAITQHAERTPRTAAFLAAYKSAREVGMGVGDARAYAVRGMNTIMGDYTKEGKSNIIREEGPLIGSTLNTLSTFMINTYAQLESMGRGGVGSHQKQFINTVVYPILAFAAVSYLATGWSGMPGPENYDKMVRKINDVMHTNFPTTFEIQQAHGNAVFGPHADDAYYGAIPNKMGKDIFQSGRMGDMANIGEFTLSGIVDLFREVYMEGKNALSKTGAVNPPTEHDLYSARHAVVPPVVQFLLENAKGKARPQPAGTPPGTPPDLRLENGVIRKGSETDLWTHLPFQDMGEKKQRDVNEAMNNIKANQDNQSKNLMHLIEDAANDATESAKAKDAAGQQTAQTRLQGLFKQLVAVNPDFGNAAPEVQQHLIENQIKRTLSPGEFEALKAVSTASLNDKMLVQKRAAFNKQLGMARLGASK